MSVGLTQRCSLQPPTQSMGMSGGMNQSGAPPQPPHGHSMPSDGPPSGPHMQNQMNGQMPGKRAAFGSTGKVAIMLLRYDVMDEGF